MPLNLQGLLIMSYVAALAVSYLLLALGHLDIYDYQSVMCGFCGFTLYYTLMASFFWLNIISFDIYWRLRRNRECGSERRKFVYYSLYAWGIPLLFLLMILLFDHTELISYELRPNIGEEGCFLKEDKLVQFLYLYLPLMVVISANIYFFAITAKRVYQTEQANDSMLNGNLRHDVNSEKDRNRFGLYLRWFIVTSVAWSLEIVSWLLTEPGTSPSWVIYLLDVCNCLAAIVIFFLFVWKQRVKKLLLQRFNCSLSSHNLYRSHSMSSIVSSYVAEGNRLALTTIESTDATHDTISRGNAP
ncbi:G-protein coupled receptor Mth2-like [Anopheles aquasalis]|uniref:G-protein coupled receptor Mth2-like n=1 Tax=Anopheles aquasalis TaxID=42839 RepID=UPI00215ABAC8|nr:G-protein coupled receptor Mth2-like [Anopheles aquasalis]